MTKAEACLWKYVLKERMLRGYQFHRQRPVLNYIADFFCKELHLVIEIDGITHHFDNVSEKDKIKQKKLENHGFIVLRYKDEDILKNLNGVKISLEMVIDDIETRNRTLIQSSAGLPPPSAAQTPPPAGDSA